jgi:hypothetical protein
MKWEVRLNTDYITPGQRVLTVEWSDWDLVQLDFDGFERMLLRECEQSVSLADILLGLELIARKIEAKKKGLVPGAR